ncbi:MAG: hypothetical protein EZS28_020013 [Streblomastix strix]|uniref:Uncharacterized protein n=1 Tax=Streblomastix strix TaxID=222440 RepID=A0A5J4VP94_9EUKA|nr:MAG: hypothetical protein EZS28_020013 [Streblomastix strix]
MDKSQALRKLKENGTSFESFDNGYKMQVGKQITVYEDGYKGLRIMNQAQQNQLLAIRPTPKLCDTSLMYVDDEDNTDEQDDDADDEEEIILKTFRTIFERKARAWREETV